MFSLEERLVEMLMSLLALRWQAALLSAILSQFIYLSMCVCFTARFPLPSARQHPSYGDCLEVKREYYQNSSVLDCVTQCSQSAAHLSEQFLQFQQIGFVALGPLRCA